MIRGVHAMFYSSQAEELRAFLRDKLGLPFTDVGQGWLIFDLPEADMGVHPSDENQPHARAGTHDVSFYCDDIGMTVAELKDRGVEFTDEVQDAGFGLTTRFQMPGNVTVLLYQPHYRKKPKEPPAQPAPPRAAAPPAKAAAGKKSRKKATPRRKQAAKKKPSTKKAAKKAKRRGGKR
jgi:catechol 2,3-dioxygenase-like lactoylglutathione lyase family enzyme